MSQIVAHAAFGGVVPEIAARAHVEILDTLIAQALGEAGVAARELDGVAAAAGPGLIGGVLVGLMAGKGIAACDGQTVYRRQSPRSPCADRTPRHQPRIPVSYAVGVGRAHPDTGGQGRRRLRPARRDDGRCDRRGLRQDRQDARPRLSRGSGGRRCGETRRSGAFCTPATDDRPSNADFSMSGLKTAVRQAAVSAAPLRPQDVADLCASSRRRWST